tara:strand:+ start:846 stop:1088 length:243 start_codon:yes stop_codon:yes gene_type:complete
MKIKMKETVKASANQEGSMTMMYESGQEYDMSNKMNIATILLNSGQAEKSIAKTEKKVIKDMEKKTSKTKKVLKKVFGKK